MNCSDSGESDTITAEVESQELWVFQLGNQPSEGGFEIIDQAKHAERSEISWDTIEGGLSYFYQSEAGFTGRDEITIEMSYSAGDSNFSFFTYFFELDVQ